MQGRMYYWELVSSGSTMVAVTKGYTDGSGNITTKNALINY